MKNTLQEISFEAVTSLFNQSTIFDSKTSAKLREFSVVS